MGLTGKDKPSKLKFLPDIGNNHVLVTQKDDCSRVFKTYAQYGEDIKKCYSSKTSGNFRSEPKWPNILKLSNKFRTVYKTPRHIRTVPVHPEYLDETGKRPTGSENSDFACGCFFSICLHVRFW